MSGFLSQVLCTTILSRRQKLLRNLTLVLIGRFLEFLLACWLRGPQFLAGHLPGPSHHVVARNPEIDRVKWAKPPILAATMFICPTSCCKHLDEGPDDTRRDTNTPVHPRLSTLTCRMPSTTSPWYDRISHISQTDWYGICAAIAMGSWLVWRLASRCGRWAIR
jgi:hypothetical protein